MLLLIATCTQLLYSYGGGRGIKGQSQLCWELLYSYRVVRDKEHPGIVPTMLETTVHTPTEEPGTRGIQGQSQLCWELHYSYGGARVQGHPGTVATMLEHAGMS